MTSHKQRNIEIAQDAIENTIITGDGNIVIIQGSQKHVELSGPVESIDHANPYMGVSAFHEQDADRFFGREDQINDLLLQFKQLHDISSPADQRLRLLAIYGPSGSGKSSIARAGLIPELARRPIPGLRTARVAVLTPGAHPLGSLASMLARILTNDPLPVTKSRELTDELRIQNSHSKHDGLRRIVDVLPQIQESPLILLIDQFEELYTLCDDPLERNIFVENLLDAVSDRGGRISLILTLRSDFLGETQKHQNLNQLISKQGYLVPAMDEAQLRRAITQPASNCGYQYDAATVDLLIAETKDRVGALPLLQFSLTRIWEGLIQGAEPRETLREIGGVGGALAGEAQRLYDELNADDQLIARRIFLSLVQLGEGTRDTRRRVALKNIIPAHVTLEHMEAVIQRFCSPTSRLITTSTNDEGQQALEITHEALFDHWELFRTWLEQSREDIRFQHRLDEAVHHWLSRGRPEGSLWRPPDLDLLLDFHERSGAEFTQSQLDFLEAALISEKKREQAEALRQKAEMLQEMNEELRDVNQNLDGKIDELAQVNMKLYEMNRMRDRFWVAASHELRTPVNSISGITELLQGSDTLTDKQKNWIDQLHQNSRILIDNLNDCLDLAQLQNGRMEVTATRFHIDELCKAGCDLIRLQAEEKGIRLEMDLPDSLPPLFQDQQKTERILKNLLTNAVQFTPAGGQITLTVGAERQGQERLNITVVDSRTENFTSYDELVAMITMELCQLLGGEFRLKSEHEQQNRLTVILPWNFQEPQK